MSWLIAVYCGNEIREAPLENGGAISIGSGNGDSIYIEKRGSGLEKAHLTLSGVDAGVHMSALAPVKIGDSDTTNRMLTVNNIARVTQQVSLAVFQRQKGHVSVSLSGQNELTIGRSGRCDIILPGSLVSSNHAVLRRKKANWELIDQGSRNGTFVNGKRVESTVLKENAVVFISGWILRYRNGELHFENMAGNPGFAPKLNSEARASGGADSEAASYPYFQRSPRFRAEAVSHEVEIQSPPGTGSKPNISWLSVLLPPFLMVVVMFVVSQLSDMGSRMLIFTIPMSVVGVLVAAVNYNSQMKKWRAASGQADEKYTKYLQEREAEVSAAESKMVRALAAESPGVSECISFAERRDRRLWERSVTDDDFLAVRIGTGTIPSNVSIKTPPAQLSLEENPLFQKANKIKERHRTLSGVPVTAALNGISAGLAGNRTAIQKMAWTILIGVATLHSYEDVKIAVIFPQRERQFWEWLRWLPHCWDEDKLHRFIACDPDDAGSILRGFDDILKVRARNAGDKDGAKIEKPHYFVLLADKSLAEESGVSLLPDSSALGMTVLYAYGDVGLLPGECGTIIECGEKAGSIYDKVSGGSRTPFTPEKVSLEMADAFARNLAPVRFRTSSAKAAMPEYIPLLEGFGVTAIDELDVMGRWGRSRPFESIAAPIGIRENGEVFSFDIHEKGMGPHGIVAGATRWGKSETLTTWLLSMALNFHPQEVNFVLIDFKGDGLSGILMDLPHVAGKISNVNDITSIERNLRSLQGELLRRQRVFMDTRQENIHKYQEAFRNGRVEQPMPYMVIVIDEFAELKTQFPDQMNNFIQIARVGGSLGIYLVLATQSPGGGIVSGQVSANSRFRICLKTSEASESKDIIGTTDAFGITVRGRAYIKVGNNEVYEQVQTFFSKAPYKPDSGVKGPATKINVVELSGSRVRPEVYDKTVGVAGADFSEGRVVAQFIKDTAARAGIQTARQVWTEALPERLTLPALLSGKEAFRDGEWAVKNEGFAVIAGLVDDPEGQRQYPLVLDFGGDGHHVLYGAPQSGKTEFVRTVLLSSAEAYTPEQVQFVALDFGTWGLKIFEGLPHTLMIADGDDKGKIKQAEQLLLSELESRKRRFSGQGVGTLEAYRDITGESVPAVLIVIDNMAALYNMYPDLLDPLTVLAREGGGLGLYLLMTAGSQGSFMYRLAQYIKCSLTLQLTDKGEYRQLVGGSGKAEPGKFPGRGFVKGPLEFQTALCAQGEKEAERVKYLRDTCTAMFEAWGGKRADLSSVLSGAIDTGELVFNGERAQIGRDKTGRPFDFVFDDMNCCVIAGSAGSGKSNLLGLIALAFSKDPECTLYLYEKGDLLKSIHTNGLAANDGAGFDKLMAKLLEEYDIRKQNGGHHPRIAVLIDDFTTFYEEISDETAGHMETILQDCADYGILFYIAGDRAGMTRFYNLSLPALARCLAKGNAVALDGRLREYRLFDAMHESEDVTMDSREGCVIHGGKATPVKLANVKEACANA